MGAIAENQSRQHERRGAVEWQRLWLLEGCCPQRILKCGAKLHVVVQAQSAVETRSATGINVPCKIEHCHHCVHPHWTRTVRVLHESTKMCVVALKLRRAAQAPIQHKPCCQHPDPDVLRMPQAVGEQTHRDIFQLLRQQRTPAWTEEKAGRYGADHF